MDNPNKKKVHFNYFCTIPFTEAKTLPKHPETSALCTLMVFLLNGLVKIAFLKAVSMT